MSASGAAPLRLADVAPLLEPYLDRRGAEAPTGIVLAVSGGPDSAALMRLAAALRPDEPVPLTVASVDHGLRPGSRAEAEAVARWAASLDLPHRILAWAGDKPRTRIQERAREERYRLLGGLARELGASHVLTGHTLDDQAETVLMRLIRGTSIGGLAGMRRETAREGVTIARPFLGLSKARLVSTCDAEGWPYLSDPSNDDPRFARTRFRRNLMPALAREGLTAERLAALAVRAARAEEALAARAAEVFSLVARPAERNALTLDGAALLGQPDAIVLKVVAAAVAAATGDRGGPIRLERLEARVLREVRPALETANAARLTLGGALIEVSGDRRILVRPETVRRRSKQGR